MDQPNQPQEPTQAVPAPSPDLPPPSSYPPTAYPPPDDSPPAYPPAPDYPPPPWAMPLDPMGPAPGLRFAPHGARLVAYIVDVILISVLLAGVTIAMVILTAALAAAGAAPLAVLSSILLIVALVTVGLGYFPWFWVNGGATPGMRIFNLRLVRDRDGGPLGWGEAILRLIGLWVASLVFYLGYIWIFIDKRHRGWQDLIAGTLMVQPA